MKTIYKINNWGRNIFILISRSQILSAFCEAKCGMRKNLLRFSKVSELYFYVTNDAQSGSNQLLDIILRGTEFFYSFTGLKVRKLWANYCKNREKWSFFPKFLKW